MQLRAHHALFLTSALYAVIAVPAFAQIVTSKVTTSVGAPVVETTTTSTTGTSAGGETGLVSTKKVTTTTTPITTTKTFTFSSNDRTTLRTYLNKTYSSTCMDGMYSYDGGCISVDEFGTVKRTYTVGEPLPTTVTVKPLPNVIVTKLAPVPEGYYYTTLDHDVLLVAKNDNRVVDSVSYYSMNE